MCVCGRGVGGGRDAFEKFCLPHLCDVSNGIVRQWVTT